MKIILNRDPYLFNYQNHFGITTGIQPTLFVDAGYMDIEPIGSVACTCFACDNLASSITGDRYDHVWLWTQILNSGKGTNAGAAPQDTFSISLNGVKKVFTGEIVKPMVAYFRVDQGTMDAFHNIQNAMQMEFGKGFKRPVAIGTKWYSEWNQLMPDEVFPFGVTPVSDHEYEICGWEVINGEQMFKINWWGGQYNYMPATVFNAAIKDTYGSVALMYAQTTQEEIDTLKSIKVSLIQQAIALCYNLLKNLQAAFLK